MQSDQDVINSKDLNQFDPFSTQSKLALPANSKVNSLEEHRLEEYDIAVHQMLDALEEYANALKEYKILQKKLYKEICDVR